jgi:hypothetical protein
MLFHDPKTAMLFGDAKDSLSKLNARSARPSRDTNRNSERPGRSSSCAPVFLVQLALLTSTRLASMLS